MNYKQENQKELVSKLLEKAVKVEPGKNYNPGFAKKYYLQCTYAVSDTSNQICVIWNKAMYAIEKTAEILRILYKLNWRNVPFRVPTTK